jgi:hypothetical protein
MHGGGQQNFAFISADSGSVCASAHEQAIALASAFFASAL